MLDWRGIASESATSEIKVCFWFGDPLIAGVALLFVHAFASVLLVCFPQFQVPGLCVNDAREVNLAWGASGGKLKVKSFMPSSQVTGYRSSMVIQEVNVS